MKKTLIIILLVFSNPSYGYVDPASGAALINIFIALIGSLLYFFKNLFYKEKAEKKPHFIGVFSEGSDYWGTFKPIIKSFIEKGVFIDYYTFDVFDPALEIESEYINATFLGEGFFKIARFNKIENKILLSTTPNIGSREYTLKRPKRVGKMIHVFHSINDISMYKAGSLDFYDEVILAGEFQKKSIIEVEKKRKLSQKKLISIGLPYIDTLVEEKSTDFCSPKTILIASSWGEKGCLKNYGINFIEKIIELNYNIIIRPHPFSFKYEKQFIMGLVKKLKKYPQIHWDYDKSPSNSLNKAHILISDTSSIRYDYSFIYEKPVITLKIKQKQMPGFERDFLNSIWSDENENEISHVIDKSDLDNINSIILKTINEFNGENIQKLKNKTIKNFGMASDKITDYLIKYKYVDKTS